MKQRSKKALSWLLSLALVLGLLPALGTTALAAWEGGTYTVSANETITGDITISDDATLTINSGVTVTVNGTIWIAEGKTLTVAGSGNLTVRATGSNYTYFYPGVDLAYANNVSSGTCLIIDGATVDVKGGDGTGTLYGGNGVTLRSNSSVTVKSGSLNAVGGNSENNVPGYGIGGPGSVTVTGGLLTASGGQGSSNYEVGVYSNATITGMVAESTDGTNYGAAEQKTSSTARYVKVTAIPVPHTHDNITFTAWESNNSLPNTAGSYYLTANVTLTSKWNVPEGTTNLCLNGHSITNSTEGNAETAINPLIYIDSGRTLALFDDENLEQPGKLLGVNYTDHISGDLLVYVNCVNCYGTFILNGGTIQSGESAIGVNAYNGSFTMNGGTITNCYTGVRVFEYATFTVSGAPTITGNTNANVVFDAPTSRIAVGALTSGASIGLTLANPGTGVFTTGIADATTANTYKSYFTSDAGYDVLVDSESSQLKLGLAPVSYIDHTVDGTTVTTETKTCESYTSFAAGTNSELTTVSAGWYVIKSGEAIATNRLVIDGTVNLILCDGATLTASKGIDVTSGNTLNIYAGNTSSTIAGTGALNATATGNYAAIGGNYTAMSGGTVTIHGGSITATATGDRYDGGAGIGGGDHGSGGNVTIYGGTVVASSLSNAYGGQGIGRGSAGGENYGTLTVASGLYIYGDGTNGSTYLAAGNGEAYTGGRYRYMVVNNVEPTPVASVTPSGGTATTYYSLAAAVSAWTDGSTLKLLADVETASTISVTSGTKTLDLNGYGIRYTGSNYVIYIGSGATLTLTDTATAKPTHYITLTEGRGTAVSDTTSTGAVEVTGGYITGGSGGGVYVNGSTFNMSGGAIVGNKSTAAGGGVYIYNSTFTLSGGKIIYNTSSGVGGGVCATDSTFNVSGAPVIKDNKRGEATNNVFLSSGKTITVGALTSGASIGVTMASPGTGTFTSGIADATTANTYKSYFTSDAGYDVLVDSESSQLKLGQAPVSYIDHTVSNNTATAETKTCESYTVFTANPELPYESGTAWFVVNDNVTISSRLSFYGTVNLILCDGKTLTLKKGITVQNENDYTSTLNIYAQSEGDAAGALIAEAGYRSENEDNAQYNDDYTDDVSRAAIGGGSSGKSCGIVTIHGGNITATGSAGAAGIGGGGPDYESAGNGGTVTIYGGTVTANGGGGAQANGGAGIGGGVDGTGGTVTIYGGTVIANGGGSGAGIGGGYGGIGGTVAIYGGTVTATGGYKSVEDDSNTPPTTVDFLGVGIGAGSAKDETALNNGTLTIGTGMYLYGGTSANPENALSNYRAGAGDYTGDRYRYMTVNNVAPKPAQTITASDVTAAYGDTGVSVSASAFGTLSYEIKTGDAVTVDAKSGALTIVKAGTATVTVTAAETDEYAAAAKNVTVTINKATLTIKANDQRIYVGGTVPTLDGADFYTVTGLVGTDTLITAPTLAYQKNGSAATPDASAVGTYDIVPSGAAAGENYEITYQNGTLTISRRSSSGGGSPTTTVTIPVSGDDETVNVTVQVKGDTATVTGADVDRVLEAEDVGTVTIDVSTLKKDVTEVVIPNALLTKINDAVADETNDTDGMEIKLPGGTVTFDADALAAITEQADGKDLTLNLDSIGETDLNAEQQAAVADMEVEAVYDAYMTSGGQRISDFQGGTATVSVPYELKEGQIAAGITVWYVADDGTRTQMTARYVSGRVEFDVPHFSNYVIVYDAEKAAACPQDDTCPMAAFSDLDPTLWYHDGIHFCLENGMMNGVGGGRFDPYGTTSRAMIVTILYRLENEPEVTAENPFSDVEDGKWYTNAVIWAAENKIVEGYGNGKFDPNGDITREQLATILYRYAQSKGQGFEGEWMFLLDYPDASEISGWADEAMHWMVMQGVINGKDGKLVPKGDASRAEAATMLQRFCTLDAE